MLPWDRLAQFVATATAEWFDVLPAFRGTLVRNFLSVESISDRLFSLLSFLHIGVPLALLVALWVHTQRVPRAHVMPPKRIAVASTAMLAVLSLAKPAVSQSPAALQTVPASLAVDWIYLPVYPLIYQWSPAMVWGLVGGEVHPGIYQKRVLTDEERAGGKILLCCATPLSDLAVECDVLGGN